MARAVAIVRALLSKGGWAGFDPSALFKKSDRKKVRHFLLLRFHPDKNIGSDIQAAKADFVEATEALEIIDSAEEKYLLRALVAWKRSLERAAQQKSAARPFVEPSKVTAKADAAEGRKDRPCGGAFSRLLFSVRLRACSPLIAIS